MCVFVCVCVCVCVCKGQQTSSLSSSLCSFCPFSFSSPPRTLLYPTLTLSVDSHNRLRLPTCRVEAEETDLPSVSGRWSSATAASMYINVCTCMCVCICVCVSVCVCVCVCVCVSQRHLPLCSVHADSHCRPPRSPPSPLLCLVRFVSACTRSELLRLALDHNGRPRCGLWRP